MRGLWVGIGFALVLASGAAAREPERQLPSCTETKDRLSNEALRELAGGPIDTLEEGDVEQAEAEFERLLAKRADEKTANPMVIADTLMAFGVAMHSAGEEGGDLQRRSLPYFRRALKGYAEVFGPDHPEVALGWATLGDAAMDATGDAPSEAIAALEEAYRIRLKTLGLVNLETAANLAALARAQGFPSRTGGDEARIAASSAMFESAIAALDALPCEPTTSDEYVTRNYLEMLIVNQRVDAAMKVFDARVPALPKDEAEVLAYDFEQALSEAGFDEQAKIIEARYPDALGETDDPMLMLMRILGGQTFRDYEAKNRK